MGMGPPTKALGVDRAGAQPTARPRPGPPRGEDLSTCRRSGRVALVGRPNVGKSTLLNALLGEPLAITSPHPQTTRESVRGVMTIENAQFVFIDTPGIHAPRTRLGRWMNDVARQAAHDADVVVLVTEAPRYGDTPGPGQDLSRADLALASELPVMPSVLVVNKIDRMKDKTWLLPLIAAFSEAHPFAATVPLSAKRKLGTDRLLDELRPMLPEQPWLFEPDTLSDQPQRFFVAELVREQVLRLTRQEVPHGVAVVVEGFDESVAPQRIDVTIHVAREAHTKILVGAGGRMLKSIGTAARARIERMLGTRVHLALRVRAAPDWMNDETRLRELGYAAPGVGDRRD
jgi:GTP-binding protein Era